MERDCKGARFVSSVHDGGEEDIGENADHFKSGLGPEHHTIDEKKSRSTRYFLDSSTIIPYFLMMEYIA